MSKATIEAIDALCEMHADQLCIEADTDDLKIWHLIYSLMIWCEAKNIDWRNLVDEVAGERASACPWQMAGDSA